jgi:prepilin-type N-terminal cleavage/methylation domain-containing protein
MSKVPERLRVRRLGSEDSAEAGLTLIELLVVLLIISILLAMVIPTFLSTAKTANGAAAPANLLYPNSRQSHLGACGGTGVSAITAIDTGLKLLSATGSTKATNVSINFSGTAGWRVPAFSPGTTDCPVTVERTTSHATVGKVAGNTNLARAPTAE